MNLADKIIGHLKESYLENNMDRLGNLSVSDVAQCQRKTLYKMRGHAPTDIPPSYGALRDGHMYHESIQSLLSELFGDNFHSAEMEIPIQVSDDVSIVGHCDGLVSLEDYYNVDYPVTKMVEIKTYSEAGWRRRIPISEEYKDQATLYMGGLNSRGIEVKETLFLLRRKDVFGLEQVEYAFDQARYDSLLRRIEGLLSAEAPEDFPRLNASDKGVLDWRCAYCQYRTLCWGENRLTPNRIVDGVVKSWKL